MIRSAEISYDNKTHHVAIGLRNPRNGKLKIFNVFEGDIADKIWNTLLDEPWKKVTDEDWKRITGDGVDE